MGIPRRKFLQTALATGGAMVVGTTVLPQTAMAEWSEKAKQAFDAKSVEDISKALFTSPDDMPSEVVIEESDKITIKAPEIAENGAVVPIKVTTTLPRVESIAIIGEKNPVPLVGQFNFPDPDNAVGWVKTRIKMGETSDVIAVVKADGKLYAARRSVKVTIGGCGG